MKLFLKALRIMRLCLAVAALAAALGPALQYADVKGDLGLLKLSAFGALVKSYSFPGELMEAFGGSSSSKVQQVFPYLYQFWLSVIFSIGLALLYALSLLCRVLLYVPANSKSSTAPDISPNIIRAPKPDSIEFWQWGLWGIRVRYAFGLAWRRRRPRTNPTPVWRRGHRAR